MSDAPTAAIPEVTIAATPPDAPAPAPRVIADPDTHLIPVTDKAGGTSFVRPEDLDEALSQGFRPATEPEYYGAKTGKVGEAASAAIGTARTLTFGGLDPALIAADRAIEGDAGAEDMRRALNLAKEVNPNATMGGEVAGAVLPLFLGDPLQALDAAATRGVEGVGARLLGEGAAARAATRFAAGVPRAALEGAMIGGGAELSEDALGDHDVTAEKLLASSAKGAVLGGLLGGTLHAGLGAVGDRLTRYGGLAPAERAATREGETVYRSASALPEEAAASADARGWIGKLADEEAFKATGAKMADYRRIGGTGEEMTNEAARLGRVFRDEGIVTPFAKRAEMAERVEKNLDEAGRELGELRKPLDTTTVRPSMTRIIERAQSDIIKPLEGLPQTAGERGVVGEWLSDMSRLAKGGESLNEWGEKVATSGDPTFEQLFKFRRRLDRELSPQWEKGMVKPMPPAFEQLQKLRGIVEDEYTRAAGEASKELGGDFGAKYALAKGRYADLKTAQKILGSETAREASNHRISLTDVIATVHGGPLGLLMGAANHVRRVYGNQIASHVLDKASRLTGVQRASAQVDGLVSKGVRGFLDGSKSAPRIGREAPKVTAETAQQIREAARSPEALTAHVAAMVEGAGLGHAAPKVSGALATTITRGVTYLASVAPHEPPPSGPSFVPQPPRKPPAADLQRFSEAVQGVDDPLSIVDDLRKGRVSRDKVEAIRTVYPRLYEQMRTEIGAHAAELRPDLTLQQQIALSVLFGEPVAKSMEPATLEGLQATYAGHVTPDETAPTGAGGGEPMPPGRPFDRQRGSMASAFDEAEEAA